MGSDNDDTDDDDRDGGFRSATRHNYVVREGGFVCSQSVIFINARKSAYKYKCVRSLWHDRCYCGCIVMIM